MATKTSTADNSIRDLYMLVARIDERTEQMERQMVSKSDLSQAIETHKQLDHRYSYQVRKAANGELTKARAKLYLALAGAITILAAAVAAYLGYTAS